MNFFAVGIVFYSWMPHNDKTGCKVAQISGDYSIRHGPSSLDVHSPIEKTAI